MKRLKKVKKINRIFIKQVIILASNSLGLVSALAWNSLIQEFINHYVKLYLPQNGTIISLGVYALVVTAITVLFTLKLTGIKEKL